MGSQISFHFNEYVSSYPVPASGHPNDSKDEGWVGATVCCPKIIQLYDCFFRNIREHDPTSHRLRVSLGTVSFRSLGRHKRSDRIHSVPFRWHHRCVCWSRLVFRFELLIHARSVRPVSALMSLALALTGGQASVLFPLGRGGLVDGRSRLFN